MDLPDHRRSLWGDALAAFALALLLCAAWAWRDWPQLSALRLPDTDDMMRLQQIRDWIGGQAFGDVSQHRLGAAPGLGMHWSRLPDLVPAGIIVSLTPWLGAHTAALAAVIVWPMLLFAAALLLVGRIARALGGVAIARTAIIVAAIAYPATTLFLPGRIDHHGLQIVLLLVIVRTLVARPSIDQGLIAGGAATLSLVIGMETAPLIAAAVAVMATEWLRAQRQADDRLMGFGIGLGAGLLAATIFFRSQQWGYPGCDGFTGTLWRAAEVMAFTPMLLALAARDIARPATRAVLAVVIGGSLAASVVWLAPECLSPYGLVDPLLVRLWLSHVGEAQSMFAAPLATATGYLGVMIAGILATGWQASRNRCWVPLLALQIAALGLACFQLRGAYAGAILAAPALAAVIAAARQRGGTALAGAWLASAGMLYPIAAQAVTRQAAPAASPGGAGNCTSAAALGRLASLPPGRLMAPLDLGAYAIGATKLSVVAAPYHRNNAGNLAAYRFFLGSADSAEQIARTWQVDYVALCDNAFAELGNGVSGDPHRMIGALKQDAAPVWLAPVGTKVDGLRVFRVKPRLSLAPPAR